MRHWVGGLGIAMAVLASWGAAVSPAAAVQGHASSSAASRPFDGFWLGVAVMALLVAAMVYALALAVRAFFGRPTPHGPDWLQYAIPALSLTGIGVAAYLTFVETRNVTAICGPVGDCNAVQSSPYAKLFGFLPVGILGLVGYLLILAAWATSRFVRGALATFAPLAVFGMALFGVLFSLYLTYIELAVILAVCAWCLTSAIIIALLLAVSAGPAMDTIALPPAVDADPRAE